MKEVYVVCCECNDKGWERGLMRFTDANEAIKHMRDYVSVYIKQRRSEGWKVDDLHIWSDSVIGTCERIESQTITFNVENVHGRDFFDFRIFAEPVWDYNEELRKTNAFRM